MTNPTNENASYPEAPVFRSPFRIDRDQTRIFADAATTTAVRDAFARSGGAVFHDVLDPDLLQHLIERSGKAAFRQVDMQEHGVRGNDLSVAASLPFCTLLARAAFLRWLEAISGCEPVTNIEGHLAQMIVGNHVEWHRDTGSGNRRLAMVLNLTTDAYEGGRFELRRKSTREPMLAYHANMAGSLAIFPVTRDFQHRVTRITSGGPRTIFSAWARGPWHEDERDRPIKLATWPPLAPLMA